MSKPRTIKIDEAEYVRVEDVPKPIKGDRHLVVLDKGFIFVGDLSTDDDGRRRLTNACNVRKWSSGGFGGLTKSSKNSDATLDPCGDVVFITHVFMVPVSVDW